MYADQAKCGRGRLQLPGFEALHMTHCLQQMDLGYETGLNQRSNTKMDKRWSKHQLAAEDDPQRKTVVNMCTRLEIQDGKRKPGVTFINKLGGIALYILHHACRDAAEPISKCNSKCKGFREALNLYRPMMTGFGYRPAEKITVTGTQRYHGRGSYHSHSITYMKRDHIASVKLESKISATIPPESERTLRGVVLDSQLDWKSSGRGVHEEPSAYDAETGLLHLHHTQNDHEQHVRAYFPENLDITKSHEDVQQVGTLREQPGIETFWRTIPQTAHREHFPSAAKHKPILANTLEAATQHVVYFYLWMSYLQLLLKGCTPAAQGDGRGHLLRYVATYTPKFSDSFDGDWLSDKVAF